VYKAERCIEVLGGHRVGTGCIEWVESVPSWYRVGTEWVHIGYIVGTQWAYSGHTVGT